ncbi:MAG: hypothetical protein CMJ83_11390 [Planctomycetes bacterium]|nr:hypothetical protein [Planctomycetota bacterium]
MGARIVAALRLVRLPNTLTAVADVLAGAAIVGVVPLQSAVLLPALGSALMYGGGVALNDLLDLEKDRTQNPERVLVRGDLSVAAAWVLALLLLAAGVATALAGSAEHRVVTLALLLAIVVYDALPDRFRYTGAAMMGSCRALNLMRGMTLGALGASPASWLPAEGHLWLVFMITVVSTFESSGSRGGAYRAALLLLPLPYLIPLATAVWTAPLSVALAVWVTRPGWMTPARPIVVVKRAVFTLVLFDALYALAAERWATAAVCAAFLPILLWLARAIGQRGS